MASKLEAQFNCATIHIGGKLKGKSVAEKRSEILYIYHVSGAWIFKWKCPEDNRKFQRDCR